MTCVSTLSTARDSETALGEALERAAQDLAGQTADLALVFASIHHADALGRLAREVRARGISRHIVGCTGESIVGEDREVEGAPALSLWAVRLPEATIEPVRLRYDGGFEGWTGTDKETVRSALLLLADPFTFPADRFLKSLSETAPGLPVAGGMASGAQTQGRNRFVLDDAVFDDGAVGVQLGGRVALRTIVSQGCRPIGKPYIVTKTEGNLIRELGRRPALEALRELFESLAPEEQALVQQGLHIGRVINEYQETFRRGDFLVRNVLGADEQGGIAITDVVRVGQTVQFHIRDADTADEDLRGLLDRERAERPDARRLGALLFSCNGRGTRLFDAPNHDVSVLHESLGPIPVAGFFAMGELGPVGGQNFVHGFTASIALFEEP
ncbi:MAG: FIST N-terminal domain-containing protein [Isosphaeraceae bacterium]|nr:FIST N-terminal domain-containing protein [Isosphaeraceae bacterium]